MKKGLWTADWFVGLILTLAVLSALAGGVLQRLEHFAYDVGVRATHREPSDKVALIAIDDESIANIGPWPWRRDVLAGILDLLKKANAKVIGNTIFFREPQVDKGFEPVDALYRFVDKSKLYRRRGKLPASLASEIRQLRKRLKKATLDLNPDLKLAAAMQTAGTVVLGMPFVPGQPRGTPDEELPDYVTRNGLLNVVDRVNAVGKGWFPVPATRAIAPVPVIAKEAVAIGHLTRPLDRDGGLRFEPLVLRYYDTYYPSMSLQLAARFLDLPVDDIKVRLGESIELGGMEIDTDPTLRMQTFFYSDEDGKSAFSVDSFYDVFTGKIPVETYQDKVVLIGLTAAGLGDHRPTPLGKPMALVSALAHSISSILNRDFLVTPKWGIWVGRGALLLVALYLVLLLPRLTAGLAAVVTATAFAVFLGAHFALITTQAVWVQLMAPTALLLLGHLGVTTKRFLVAQKGKDKLGAESAQNNRMLGLAYQGKGQLDMAFEKFRTIPLSESIMDPLYNLALDFERRRQFSKAGAVYQYMAGFNPNFRDLERRMTRNKAMAETAMFGTQVGAVTGKTLVLNGEGVQRPMLGRYQIEKELAKGAMGIVYLGKDPKANRTVAIKTMALSQEFGEDELEEVKARFFHEAETAGRLNHPNIVTIYDAGEVDDLAYIAMEFLKGHDLGRYTRPDDLLPVLTVIDIVARAADALDYAHGQNVVHHDIKPANIMYEPDTGNMKLTDFGIARILDSSKTRTGMVLGTPSYMSPEQLAGRKVDGHSDLFSLGVMLFQLTTGMLPFQGDSMATLMFKIANELHPDVTALRGDLPICLKAVIDKALEKDVGSRYRTGREMARDLRACGERCAT